MSLGLLAALKHSADRMKRDNDRLRDRMDERISNAGSRRDGVRDLPGEALACPSCQASYAFGTTCPDCDEPLVGAAFAHTGPAPPPPARWRGLLIGAASGALAMIVVVILHELIYW